MSNCLFGFPVWSDVGTVYTPTFSLGSWSTSLPRTNMQDRRLSKVARTSTAAVADTQFLCDLKAARRVGILALVGHTISQAGTVRARGSTVAAAFDSLTVGDAAWGAGGAPTRTPAAFTGADGVKLDLVADTSGAAVQYYFRTLATLYTGNAQKAVAVRVAKGTVNAASGSQLNLFDNTAAAYRLKAGFTWSGATLVVTMTTGTLLSSTLLPNGDYRVVLLTTAVTAANSHALEAIPAVTLAEQGNIYMGDITTWDAATDQTVYDSGYVAAWPSNVYPTGTLNTGDPRIGGGYTAEEAVGYGVPVILIPATPVTAQFWKVEIADSTNAAGYVDIGRLVIANSYVPTLNMDYGARVGLASSSTSTETDGGAMIHRAKKRRRIFDFVLSDLPQDEALGNFFELQLRYGTTEQFFFVMDPANANHLTRTSALVVARAINALSFPYYVRVGVPVSLAEEL